ncbi:unnamed protein product [marine sediment metagenome]|uniref:Uncharacterized protein n=1 Tax=marine sediment metagenome TaxID=412755 RepID=X1MFX6_9ZZZZ
MRKLAFVLAILIVLALSTGGFAFQNEPEGFRGLKWGDPPGEDMELIGVEYVYSEGGEYISRYDVIKRRRELLRLLSNEAWEKYIQDMPSFCQYKRKNDELKIGEAKLKYIYYKFYKRQFMSVEIGVDSDYVDLLTSILELKFGEGEYIRGSSSLAGYYLFRYAQKGHIAGIALIEASIYDNYEDEETLTMTIYSTKIVTQKREEEEHQVEEEKRKVAEKGSDDF